MSVPTQEHGHTLDVVLTYGFTVYNAGLRRCLLCPVVKSSTFIVQYYRVVNSFTGAQLSVAFNSVIRPAESLGFCSNIEVLLSHINLTCQSMLDEVTPLKTRSSKPRPEPWINDRTITQVLASLHWLPAYLVDFKILLFAFKCLHGLSPQYLSNLL